MPRVLVVDDTPSIRFLIRTNLELAGFEVDEAVDGVDCLDHLARADSAIRANARTRHIAIVMVTTQGHPADIQRATQAGVDAYVTKPFDPDFLVLTVRNVMGRSKNRDGSA
jgi:DNA-binding response OmpR family regulator